MPTELKSIIESILFISGDPISVKKISKITGKDSKEIESAINELTDEYKNGGLCILRRENEVQMVSAPATKDYVNKLAKNELEEELSRASLEVLSVIAYRGPVSRAQVEEIRGVNCSFTLRNLLIRGLIERVENPQDSRSYLYKISFDFLKHLGIGKIEEMPNYAELKNDHSVNEPEAKN